MSGSMEVSVRQVRIAARPDWPSGRRTDSSTRRSRPRSDAPRRVKSGPRREGDRTRRKVYATCAN